MFYAAIPPTAAALVADHVAPEERAGMMATLGAASGAGMVAGPAVAGLLAPYGLALPLYDIAVLPIVAFIGELCQERNIASVQARRP